MDNETAAAPPPTAPPPAAPPPAEPPSAAPPPDTPSDKGASYEKIAFNFCKAATIVLLAGKYALPVASGLAALFFFLAHRNGKHDTRCILSKPIIAGWFWTVVCAISVYLLLRR